MLKEAVILMSEKKLERVMKSIDVDVKPPEGLKERMLDNILKNEGGLGRAKLSPIESFVFKNPLRAAFALSILISGILRIVVGNGYTDFLSNVMGIR